VFHAEWRQERRHQVDQAKQRKAKAEEQERDHGERAFAAAVH
jgi:hypothetical protein